MLLKDKKSIFNYILYFVNSLLVAFTYILLQRRITSTEIEGRLFTNLRFVFFLGIFVCSFLIFMICEIGEKHSKIEVKVKKIASHPMFTITFAVTVFRQIVRWYFLNYTIYYDTKTYTNYNFNIFKGETDIFRTPGYPYFLKIIKKITRLFVKNTSTLDSVFYSVVAIIQSFLSIACVILIYLIARKIFKNKTVALVTAAFYGILPCVFNYDTCILTESVSFFCMVLFIYLVFLFIENPKIYKAVVLGLFAFVMIMVRPTFIYVLPILAVFFIARFIFESKDRKKCIAGFLSVVFSGLLLLGYCGLNYKNYDYFNISSVSVTVNRLKIVMDNHWQKNKDYEEISNYINSQMKVTDPNYWIPNIIEKLPGVYSYQEIDDYVNDCISKHKKEFSEYNFEKAKSISNLPIAIQYSAYKTIYKDTAVSKRLDWFNSTSFSITFIQSMLLVLFSLVFAFFVLIRRKKICWQVVGLSAIIFSHIFVSVYGSMAEFARLSSMAIPAIVLLVFYFVDLFVSRLKGRKIDGKYYSKISFKKEVEQ